MIGKLVKFNAPTLHGPMALTGTVQRILPDGRLEVRPQQHGYWKLLPSEVSYHDANKQHGPC